ncbi:hypothetical protein D3C72_1364490 [compost metagenome]
MFQQRERGEDRQLSGAVVEDNFTQLQALAGIELFTEIALNVHQHVGVVFARRGLFQNRHQFLAIDRKKGLQIVPFVKRRHKRPDLAITRLIMRQQLQLVAAVKGQQRTARQAAGAEHVQLVQGKYPRDKVLPQYRIVQPPVFLHRQPRVFFLHRGGEEAVSLFLARITRFVVDAHALHAAAWRFGADDEAGVIGNTRQIVPGKLGHFMGDVFMGGLGKTHVHLTVGRFDQSQRRARDGQAHRHFRAYGFKCYPLRQCIH